MALYEFDENNIVKSSAVDKNGYHRDGGNVFVEDVFPMGGDPYAYTGETYWYASCIIDVNKHKFPDAADYQMNDTYVYFGDKIDDSAFELELSGNKITISNYVSLNMLYGYSRSTVPIIRKHHTALLITIDTTAENNSLPENWKDLKAHIVIACRKKDSNGNYIENNYGIIQIHQS